MVAETKASSNFMLDAAIVELASEAVLYEVCKCGSLRGWNRIDASMKGTSLKDTHRLEFSTWLLLVHQIMFVSWVL